MGARTNLDLADRSDADLVRLTQGGEHEAYGVLIQRCNQRLFRVARAILRDDADAEDVLQEAYVRAFAALPVFRGEAQVRTWLTRIVINEARGRLRHRRPTVELREIETAQADAGRIVVFPASLSGGDPERRAATAEALRLLEHAIDALPAPFRLVFVLREIEGLSVAQTAAQLGLQAETVKTRLHRARRHLREALDEKLAPTVREAFPFLGVRCARLRTAVLARLAIHGGRPKPRRRQAAVADAALGGPG